MFSQIGETQNVDTYCLKHVFFKKGMLKQKQKTPAASPKRRKWGLGLPIHIKYQLILINIIYYIILVLNRTLYINYIEFPSRIRLFPIDWPKPMAWAIHGTHGHETKAQDLQGQGPSLGHQETINRPSIGKIPISLGNSV